MESKRLENNIDGSSAGEGGRDLARRKAEREPRTIETARRTIPHGRESQRERPQRKAAKWERKPA